MKQKKNTKKSTSKNKKTKLEKNILNNTLVMKIFLGAFAFIFFLLIIGTLFYNQTLYSVATTANNLIGFLIGITIIPLIFIGINKLFDKHDIKKINILYIILFIIFVIGQFIVLHYASTDPSWDWRIVYNSALNYVKGNLDKVEYFYFTKFPNNSYLFIMEVAVFKILKIFGILSYSLTVIKILNLIAVDIAAVLTILTIKKMFGNKQSIYGFVLVLLSSAFYLYLPIVYTDTIPMPIPIAMLYAYICMDRENNNILINKKNIILSIIIGFLTILGIKLKFTCIIMLLGIIVDLVFNKRIKFNLKPLGIIIACIISFFFIFKAVESRIQFFVDTKDNALPYTHWIMMGMYDRPSELKGKKFIGTYNAELYEYTYSLGSTENMVKGHIKKIIAKLKDYGVFGYTNYLYRKGIAAWGDGTYSASRIISELPTKKDNLTQQIVYPSGKYFIYLYLKDTALVLFIYITYIFGAIYSIKNNKDLNNKVFITIFGLLTFLLIWESWPRYIAHYVPILLVGCIPGIEIIIDKFSELKEKYLVKNK